MKLLGNTVFANTLQWFWKVNLIEEKLLVGFWRVRGISTGLAWPVTSWAHWCSQSWCKTIPANPSAQLGECSSGRASTGSSLFSRSYCCFGTSQQTELGQKGVLLVCWWVFIYYLGYFWCLGFFVLCFVFWGWVGFFFGGVGGTGTGQEWVWWLDLAWFGLVFIIIFWIQSRSPQSCTIICSIQATVWIKCLCPQWPRGETE